MDDLELYGDTFELLTFKEAIEAKEPAICDYKFVTIEISEQEVRQLWRDNKYLRARRARSGRGLVRRTFALCL